MIRFKKTEIVKKVEFYTHVVVTTPQDRSSSVGFCAMAKGYFQACALRYFCAFLLPATVVEGSRSDLLKVPLFFT